MTDPIARLKKVKKEMEDAEKQGRPKADALFDKGSGGGKIRDATKKRDKRLKEIMESM